MSVKECGGDFREFSHFQFPSCRLHGQLPESGTRGENGSPSQSANSARPSNL